MNGHVTLLVARHALHRRISVAKAAEGKLPTNEKGVELKRTNTSLVGGQINAGQYPVTKG